MFTTTVDITSRKAMIKYLTEHFRYYTLNPWNLSKSYANCVKLNRLSIPDEISDKAYDFLCAQCDDYHQDVCDAICDFETETGYSAGFNGRSDGYIVMYDTIIKNDVRHVRFAGIDENEDFEDWDDDDLITRTKLVQKFDKLCDTIRDIFLYYVSNTNIVDDVEIIRRPIKVAVIKENE